MHKAPVTTAQRQRTKTKTNMTIHRYLIAVLNGQAPKAEGGQGAPFNPEATLMMPAGAKPVSVGLSSKGLNVFALVDASQDPEPRQFRLLRTGDEIPVGFAYVGSITLPGAPALHIFAEELK